MFIFIAAIVSSAFAMDMGFDTDVNNIQITHETFSPEAPITYDISSETQVNFSMKSEDNKNVLRWSWNFPGKTIHEVIILNDHIFVHVENEIFQGLYLEKFSNPAFFGTSEMVRQGEQICFKKQDWSCLFIEDIIDFSGNPSQRTKHTQYFLQESEVFGWGYCGEGTLLECPSEATHSPQQKIPALSNTLEIQRVWQDLCFRKSSGWSCFFEGTGELLEVENIHNPLQQENWDLNTSFSMYSFTPFGKQDYFSWTIF